MAEDWISLLELSKRARVAETTARRYVDWYGPFFPQKRYGRFIKYSTEGIEILQRVASYFQEGWTKEQVAEALANDLPATYNVESISITGHGQSSANQPEVINELIEVIKEFQNENRLLRQEVAELRREVEDGNQERKNSEMFIRSRVNELEDRLSKQIEWATVKISESKKPWWKFW